MTIISILLYMPFKKKICLEIVYVECNRMSSHQHAARRLASLTGHCHTQPHALHHLRWACCGRVIGVGSGMGITFKFSKGCSHGNKV